MKCSFVVILLGVVALCAFAPAAVAQPHEGTCDARTAPVPGNAIRFFGPIFRGEFLIQNRFDHDKPFEFIDGNGFQVDRCGRKASRELDGHAGYDFLTPSGTPILAPADGTVVHAGSDSAAYCPYLGYVVRDQISVRLLHELPDGRRIGTVFTHLSRLAVRWGEAVREGELLGFSGSSGCSTRPHLHFETVLIDGTPSGRPAVIDPFGWAGPDPDPWAVDENGAPSIWLWKDGVEPGLAP